MNNLENLRTYLNGLGVGQIPFGHISEIEQLLRDCWHELEITTDDAKLESYKLLNRTEGLSWNPPLLTFQIERHGATVNSSVYAEVHAWTINVENGETQMAVVRKRQVSPKDRPLNVQPLAQDIAALITNGKKDGRLSWKGADHVQVLIGEVIPATKQQTTSSRRKRFRTELVRLLQARGWVMNSTNRFSRVR